MMQLIGLKFRYYLCIVLIETRGVRGAVRVLLGNPSAVKGNQGLHSFRSTLQKPKVQNAQASHCYSNTTLVPDRWRPLLKHWSHSRLSITKPSADMRLELHRPCISSWKWEISAQHHLLSARHMASAWQPSFRLKTKYMDNSESHETLQYDRGAPVFQDNAVMGPEKSDTGWETQCRDANVSNLSRNKVL